MLDLEIDKKISEVEGKLEELRQQKEAQAKRMQGFEEYDEAVRKLFDEYGISEYDIFTVRSKAIVEWVKAQGKKADKPDFYEELQAYFARVGGAKAGRKKAKASGKTGNEVKLELGVYENPNTGEKIEKKRRNPKTLDLWLEEFGVETVQTWLVK